MPQRGNDHSTIREPTMLRGLIVIALVICAAIIITAGWFGKSDSRVTGTVAHVRTQSTTGSR
jgi:hypothetical protein